MKSLSQLILAFLAFASNSSFATTGLNYDALKNLNSYIGELSQGLKLERYEVHEVLEYNPLMRKRLELPKLEKILRIEKLPDIFQVDLERDKLFCQSEIAHFAVRDQLEKSVGIGNSDRCINEYLSLPENERPQIRIAFENHVTDSANRKRLLQNSIRERSVVLTEYLSDSSPAVGHARYFRSNDLNYARFTDKNYLPKMTSAWIRGLDNEQLRAIRAVELILEILHEPYRDDQGNQSFSGMGSHISHGPLALFTEELMANRYLQDSLSGLTGLTPEEVAKFNSSDARVRSIWLEDDENREAFRERIKFMGMALEQHAGHAANIAHAWKQNYEEIRAKQSGAANGVFKLSRYDDLTFSLVLRTVLAKMLSQFPFPKAEALDGMLYRDWAFTSNTISGLCTAVRKKSPSVTVIVGALHAARLTYLLREKLGQDAKISWLNLSRNQQVGSVEDVIALWDPKSHCKASVPPAVSEVSTSEPVVIGR